MAFQMALTKENNHVHVDFPTAYWAIENIRIGNQNGLATVLFDLCAYPSRDAKYAHLYPLSPTLGFGGAIRIAYETVIYQWTANFLATEVFGDALPLTEAGQRAVLYPFVKAYLGLTEAVDVLED